MVGVVTGVALVFVAFGSVQGFETSVNVVSSIPSQDYTHPDDHNLPTYDCFLFFFSFPETVYHFPYCTVTQPFLDRVTAHKSHCCRLKKAECWVTSAYVYDIPRVPQLSLNASTHRITVVLVSMWNTTFCLKSLSVFTFGTVKFVFQLERIQHAQLSKVMVFKQCLVGSRLWVITRVCGVLKRTVVDYGWSFENLCRIHHYSRSELRLCMVSEC